MTATLGKEWEIVRMTVKPYPVCQYSHTTLDTVAEPREARLRPRTAHEAKFSVQWNIVTSLIDGYLSVDHFCEEELNREDVRDLAATVHVHRRPFDGPLAEAPGDVRVTLHGGKTLTPRVSSSSTSPDRPRDEGAVFDKFASNVGSWVEDSEGIANLVTEDGRLPVTDLMAMTGRR